MPNYKYDENTGEVLYDENTGEPILADDSIVNSNKQYLADSLKYNSEPTIEDQMLGQLLPRTAALPDSSSKFRMLASVPLDIASLPGRSIAGLGAGLGELFAGRPEKIPEVYTEVLSRKGANPENGTISQIVEGTVKDPLLIPSLFIPVAGITRAGSIPKAIGIGAGLGAGANIGLGIGENISDTNREIGQDLLSTGIAGGLAGGIGSGAEEAFSAFGRTPTARAILKKFTPTELKAGQQDQLANMIKKGWDVDIRDDRGNIDAKKLGLFLDKQSSDFGGTRQTAYQDYVDAALKSEGEKIGMLRSKKIEKEKSPSELEDVISELESGTLGFIDPEKHAKLIDIAKRKTMFNEFGERRPVSEEAINDFISELETLGFSKNVPESTSPMNDRQLAELNQYLYNAGRETSPKYHPSKEQFAAELRTAISDELGKTTGKEGARYSALKTLQNKMMTSKHFNPDRPTTFGQGVREFAAENIPDVRQGSRVGSAVARQIAKPDSKIQTQIETNIPREAPGYNDFYNEFLNIKDRQTLNAAMRALDIYNRNPNDTNALNTVKQYYTMKK